MPRSVKVTLKEWASFTETELSENLDILLDTYRHLQNLYPVSTTLDVFEHASSHPEQIWVVCLNISDNDSSESAIEGQSVSYEPDLEADFGLQEKKAAAIEQLRVNDLGNLKSFPVSNPVKHGEDIRLGGMNARSSSSSSMEKDDIFTEHRNEGLLGLKTRLSPDLDAIPGQGSSNLMDSHTFNAESFLGLPPLDEELPALITPNSFKELPPLDDDWPGGQDMIHGIHFSLGDGSEREYVAGLAIAIPSTQYVPPEVLGEDSTGEADAGDPQQIGLGNVSGGHVRRAQTGSKSCDVCIYLNLDPQVRRKIFEASQVEIISEMEQQLIQDAIFELVLRTETMADLLGVVQFQVLLADKTEFWESLDQATFLAFLNMGFVQEHEEDFRGSDDVIRVLRLRADKQNIQNPNSSSLALGQITEQRKVDKGKGKARN